MKTHIKYKIKDSNGAHEALLSVEQGNLSNEKNVLLFLKKFHADIHSESVANINLRIDAYEKETNHRIIEESRKNIVDEFCFYDAGSIQVISINGIIVDEIIEGRLLYKLTALSGNSVDVLVLDFKSLSEQKKQEFLDKIKHQ